MSLRNLENTLGRPRCRQWTPLLTQQLRLRHLYQILAYNINSQDGSFYYTLHLTTMCAPFFTSEKIESPHPKWADLDINNLQQYSSSSTFVLRIWKHKEGQGEDKIILTWGIALSGLIYLGTKLSDIQPNSFNDNSIILYLRGGYFTCLKCIRNDTVKPLPFIDNINVSSDGETVHIFRNTTVSCSHVEIRNSCNIQKLQRIHSLQTQIRNKYMDAQALRDKINSKCGLSSVDIDIVQSPIHKHSSSPHLLNMTSLNKLLHQQDKPSRLQRQEIIRIKKSIESAKFRTKLLAQERDRKLANIRQLNVKCSALADTNEDNEIRMMDQYRQLNREFDRLKDARKYYYQARELYFHKANQLANRRRQLNAQLLQIYPIHRIADKTFSINGIYLPDSDTLLDSTERGLSVAVGYVTHAVSMCSSFLQVPVRYPMTHYGSRSTIIDHISSVIPNREREFPLYTSKDRLQFNYAVYLLNKNIAQLRWYCGQATSDLRATLSNLLSLLQGKSLDQRCDIGIGLNFPAMSSIHRYPEFNFLTESQEILQKLSAGGSSSFSENATNISHNIGIHFGSSSNVSDPILDSIRHESQLEHSRMSNSGTPIKRNRRKSPESGGPGLSEILAMPEMLLSRQISPNALKNYVASERQKNRTPFSSPLHGSQSANVQPDQGCDISTKNSTQLDTSIEQGTDILDSCLNLATPVDFQSETSKPPVVTDTNVGIVSALSSNDCSDRFSFTMIKESKSNSDSENNPYGGAVLRNKSIRNSGGIDSNLKSRKRISRSVGSYTDEDRLLDLRQNLEIGSDPLLNVSSDTSVTVAAAAGRAFDQNLNDSLEKTQKEFLQKWMDSGPTLVCSEENLYPEEYLGTTSQESRDTNVENSGPSTHLTNRTNALVQRTSFNMVKPK